MSQIPTTGLTSIDQRQYRVLHHLARLRLRPIESRRTFIHPFFRHITHLPVIQGGGIWMDSTLLLTAPVLVDTSDYFHSIKIADGGHTTISEYRWATFFLASAPNNPAFGIIKTIFLAYIREHGKMIDYFLIDYIFDLVYRRNGSFRQSVDKTPCTSPYLHQLIFDMNKPYNAETFNRIQQKTTLFKLNYRLSFHETAGGQETLYGYLKKNSNSRNKR